MKSISRLHTESYRKLAIIISLLLASINQNLKEEQNNQQMTISHLHKSYQHVVIIRLVIPNINAKLLKDDTGPSPSQLSSTDADMSMKCPVMEASTR